MFELVRVYIVKTSLAIINHLLYKCYLSTMQALCLSIYLKAAYGRRFCHFYSLVVYIFNGVHAFASSRFQQLKKVTKKSRGLQPL